MFCLGRGSPMRSTRRQQKEWGLQLCSQLLGTQQHLNIQEFRRIQSRPPHRPVDLTPFPETQQCLDVQEFGSPQPQAPHCRPRDPDSPILPFPAATRHSGVRELQLQPPTPKAALSYPLSGGVGGVSALPVIPSPDSRHRVKAV